MIRSKNPRHIVVQLEVNPNLIMTRSHTFPHASRQIHDVYISLLRVFISTNVCLSLSHVIGERV